MRGFPPTDEYRQLQSKRAKRAWASGKYDGCHKTRSDEYKRIQSEKVRRAWQKGLFKGRKQYVIPSEPTKDQADKIRAFVAGSRLPWKVLAHEIGVSEPTLLKWRKVMDLPIDHRKKAIGYKLTPELREHILTYRGQWKDLYAELNISRQTIARWRRQMGLMENKKGARWRGALGE